METYETLYDLLMSCPDEELTHFKVAYKAVFEGRFEDAAFTLRNIKAGAEYVTPWHERCGEMARKYIKLAK